MRFSILRHLYSTLPVSLRSSWFRASGLLLGVAGSLLVLAACETDVSVLEDDTSVRYSLYGTFQQGKTDHFVRVEPVQDRTVRGTDAPLDDVTVTWTNLDTGAEQTLSQEMIRLGDADVVVFRALGTPQPGARYRVAVDGPDGQSFADFSMPPRAPTIAPQDTLIQYNCQREQPTRPNPVRVVVEDAERIATLDPIYYVQPVQQGFHPGNPNVFESLRSVSATTPPYEVRLQTERHLLDAALQQYEFPPFGGPSPATADSMKIASAAASPEWPEEASVQVSLDVFAQPTAYSNVTNGVGLVGGVASDTVSVPVISEKEDCQL